MYMFGTRFHKVFRSNFAVNPLYAESKEKLTFYRTVVLSQNYYLVTIDKNRLEVTGIPDPTPFSITVRMHIRKG